MAFIPWTPFGPGKVTSTQLNNRIGALLTELQMALGLLVVTTDWTDFTLASGATIFGKKPQYRVIGGKVEMRGGISFAFTASGGPFTLTTNAPPFDSTTYGGNLRILCPTNNGVCALSPRTSPAGLVAYTFGVPSTAPTSIVLDGVPPWQAS